LTLQTPAASELITTSQDLILWVACSAGAGTVTTFDPGLTPAGSAATNAVISVGAGVTKAIYLPATLINTTTGQIRVDFAVGTFLCQVFLNP
jgi:hypothetical protein